MVHIRVSAFYLVLPSSLYSQLILSCLLQFEWRSTSLLTKHSDRQVNHVALGAPTLEGPINTRTTHLKSLNPHEYPISIRFYGQHFHIFLSSIRRVCVCALAFVVAITKAIIAYTGNSVPPLAFFVCITGNQWTLYYILMTVPTAMIIRLSSTHCLIDHLL
jgi:hypothetical protein